MSLRIARRAVLAPAAVAIAALLGACGVSVQLGSDSPTTASPSISAGPTRQPGSGSSPTPVDAASCKEQLDSAEAVALAGTSMRGPKELPVLSLISCRWRGGTTRVSTMEGTMAAWEDLVPASMLANFRSLVHLSGSRCELFEAMTGASHGSTSPGPDHLIRYIPGPEHPRAVEAQQCKRGRFSSVLLKSADLDAGSAVESRMTVALAALAD